MNPTEIYQFVTALIREGAEVIAAFVFGLFACAYLLWQFGFLGNKDLRKRLGDTEDRLRSGEDKNLALARDLAGANAAVLMAQKDVANERERRERAEQDRAEVEKKLTGAREELD